MLGDGGDENDDAEGDQRDSGEDGETRLVRNGVGLGSLHLTGLHLTKEESESGDGEAHTHEAEAGAYPGEEGALSGEVDAGIAFGGGGRRGHGLR